MSEGQGNCQDLDLLAAGIERLLGAIGAGDGAEVAAAVAEVDSRYVALGSEAPARLRHFLAQRSYQKALDLLRTEVSPPSSKRLA